MLSPETSVTLTKHHLCTICYQIYVVYHMMWKMISMEWSQWGYIKLILAKIDCWRLVFLLAVVTTFAAITRQFLYSCIHSCKDVIVKSHFHLRLQQKNSSIIFSKGTENYTVLGINKYEWTRFITLCFRCFVETPFKGKANYPLITLIYHPY